MDINSRQSVADAASQAAYSMMRWYAGNETGQIPGKLIDTWWEGGAMFMALIQYWHFTGDTTYNDEVTVGMEFQAGNGDYMPSNYSNYIGNDDQMFWGLAAMTAAELAYPEAAKGYSWLSLAQGVFNTQVQRWDTSACGGGMRWQIWSWEAGYTMKNSISNGGLFQLSARLARYTYNETYADWATKIWNWSTAGQTPLVDTQQWKIGDSVSMSDNCSTVDHTEWSYNYGTYLSGAAYMYNYTNGSAEWLSAVNGLLGSTLSKFAGSDYGNVLTEDCETTELCNRNEILFKGLTAGWMAFVALIVPSTYNTIMSSLQTSGVAAAASCVGYNNNTCGVKWYTKSWDNQNGLEEQMSALNIFWANLIMTNNASLYAPVTSRTGGNSSSNPTAGSTDPVSTTKKLAAISTADKAGAGILTALFAAVIIAVVYWTVAGSE
ncbi:glycosyl hydrolase, putative [Talaromyces stipitatus ATCC 10500]|uniref:Mannan endo-1,6-alpha-mannosidase n=1 Tax=Talaromyces stipitatus (strain ATCC 10500 / CBS 375.48 / QM 6759 / NRRL 1006) TaxID=441959 RepID=B8LZY2_TALSN|nr:glycosyl hydrolase, putative [Talaromyces stipitatus ATCC 10500]EED20914.1 glycosyl hydrolase, putative [Talaromyces stipitatus ATCC 10500]